MDPSVFGESDLVLSGHFHSRSRRGNIEYIGSTGQYTWADHDDRRGFVILDTDDLSVRHIETPYEAFAKLHYDDSEGEDTVMERVSRAQVEGRYVKLVIRSKNDPYLLERVIDRVESSGVVDLQVVESGGSDSAFDPNSVSIVDETDTLKVLTEMVPDDEAKTIMKDLYSRAQMRV